MKITVRLSSEWLQRLVASHPEPSAPNLGAPPPPAGNGATPSAQSLALVRQPVAPAPEPGALAHQPAAPEPPPATPVARPPAAEPPPAPFAPAPELQPSRPPLPRGRRSLVVGVDFGASSTKVVWRDATDNHFEVLRWPRANGSGEALSLPSTVTFRNESIHVGYGESDLQEGDVWIQSLKLCVLCRQTPSICRCGNVSSHAGLIRVPWLKQPQPAAALACLFLAYVFQQVEARLEARFPDDDLTLSWNVGCPMDRRNAPDRHAEWGKLVAAAMELRSALSHPVPGDWILKAAGLVESVVIPPSGARNFFIQPQGLAAIKAFAESPPPDAGLCAIVDIGSGATEVSLFSLGGGREPDDSGLPAYLADSTEDIGGGSVDLQLAAALACGIHHARRQKEAGLAVSSDLPVFEAISRQYLEACSRASRRLRRADDDKSLDLFIIGGGGRMPALRRVLQSLELPDGLTLARSLPLQPPERLSDHALLAAEFDLLANALGLASSLEWEYYPPERTPYSRTPELFAGTSCP